MSETNEAAYAIVNAHVSLVDLVNGELHEHGHGRDEHNDGNGAFAGHCAIRLIYCKECQ